MKSHTVKAKLRVSQRDVGANKPRNGDVDSLATLHTRVSRIVAVIARDGQTRAGGSELIAEVISC